MEAGSGMYTSAITGLTPGAAYHVRAYARNSVGTAYGNDVTFTAVALGSITTISDGDWSDPATWQYGLVPEATQDAVINHMVILDVTGAIASLQISADKVLGIAGANRLTINGSATIAGTLDVADGTCTTAGNTSVTDTLLMGAGAYTAEGVFDAPNGSVIFSDAGTLTLSGAVACHALGAFTRSEGCTVAYDADSDQSLDNVGYHHLSLAGSGTRTLCGDLTEESDIAGDLTLNEGVTLDVSENSFDMAVAGDWRNSGTFAAGGGTVTFSGADQAIAGASTFYNLTKNITSAAVLSFESGSASRTTIISHLDLQGTEGALLSLRSDVAGDQWELDPQGGVTITYLDVQDSDNVSGTDIDAGIGGSVDSGNNTAWLFFILPQVSTGVVEDIGTTTATGNGGVIDLGRPDPQDHGVCWSTSPDPTITNDVAALGAVSATGTFAAAMTGLEPDTLYYVRAYAINSAGTAYGAAVTFRTYSTLDTDEDGILDYLDEDDDGDGITDLEEGTSGHGFGRYARFPGCRVRR